MSANNCLARKRNRFPDRIGTKKQFIVNLKFFHIKKASSTGFLFAAGQFFGVIFALVCAEILSAGN